MVNTNISNQTAQALVYYESVLARQPDNISALKATGKIYKELGRLEEAIINFKKLMSFVPNDAESHYMLGTLYSETGELNSAFREYSQALKYQPDNAKIHCALLGLAEVYNDIMMFDNAIMCFDEILKYHNLDVLQQLKLYFLNYNPGIDARKIFNEHALWGKSIEASYPPVFHSRISRPKHNKLKIGYVSPDFYSHPVACFIKPVLEKHDKTNFEIYCYANVEKPDVITEKLKSQADFWRDFRGNMDTKENKEGLQDLFKMICEDEIDILVDLTGHTGHNSLAVFASKPAPIQVTWLGYPNTTGLSVIDYRLTDGCADPVGLTDKYYTEELFRLPNSFLCFSPVNSAPLAEPPVCKNGYITFGSYSHYLKKVTPDSIKLWAEVLRQIPDSKLIMKSNYLDGNRFDLKTRLSQMFEDSGLDSGRIIFEGFQENYKNHLQMFNEVDIILDPLRYSGTTGTCEALWMGVPVITLAGDMHVSRVSASLLSNVGLEHLAAGTKKQYVQIAKDLATDIPRLKFLRQNLREVMFNSPIMNADLFTENLENAYRLMWKRWLER